MIVGEVRELAVQAGSARLVGRRGRRRALPQSAAGREVDATQSVHPGAHCHLVHDGRRADLHRRRRRLREGVGDGGGSAGRRGRTATLHPVFDLPQHAATGAAKSLCGSGATPWPRTAVTTVTAAAERRPVRIARLPVRHRVDADGDGRRRRGRRRKRRVATPSDRDVGGPGQRRRVAADQRRFDGAVPAGGGAQTTVERPVAATCRHQTTHGVGGGGGRRLVQQQLKTVETRPPTTVSLVRPAIAQRTLVVIVV